MEEEQGIHLIQISGAWEGSPRACRPRDSPTARYLWIFPLDLDALTGCLASSACVVTQTTSGLIIGMLLFLVAGFFGDRFTGTAGEEQVRALFGSFSIGIVGYAAIVVLIVLIGVVTAGASRLTVYRTLGSIE